MNMIKTVAVETKLNIAVEALKNPALKAKELAQMFDVSESTVKRAKKDYAEQAQKELDALTAKKAKVKANRSKVQDFPRGARGFKGRNGRWDILNEMFAELGVDKPARELWEEANKRSVDAGLSSLNRGSFYAMLSIAKKARTVTEIETPEE